MPTKSVIVAILGVALVFGVTISGCKRKRDDRVASATSRSHSARQGRKAHGTPGARPSRPAEVLSASAYRPAARRNRTRTAAPRRPRYEPQYHYNRYPQQYPAGYKQMQVYPPSPDAFHVARTQSYEPLPEPAPANALYREKRYYHAPTVEQAQMNGTPAAQQQTQTTPNPYGDLPEYAYKPTKRDIGFIPPSPGARPESPDLAMARARLEPLPVPPPPAEYTPRLSAPQPSSPEVYKYNFISVPPVEPQQFSAPLPELEPVQYQGIAATPEKRRAPLGSIPTVPVLTAKEPKQATRQSDTAARPVDTHPGEWVPSPATAMFW